MPSTSECDRMDRSAYRACSSFDVGAEQRSQAVLRDIDLDAVRSDFDATDQGRDDCFDSAPAFDQALPRSDARARIKCPCPVRPMLAPSMASSSSPRLEKKPAKPLDDDGFEVAGGDTTARRMGFAATFHERRRHVVSVSRALLDRPCWRQPLPGLVEEQTGQQAWRLGVGAGRPLRRGSRRARPARRPRAACQRLPNVLRDRHCPYALPRRGRYGSEAAGRAPPARTADCRVPCHRAERAACS